MIYIFTHNIKSPGIMVIVNKLEQKLKNDNIKCRIISSLNEAEYNDMVIPYGPRCSYEVIKSGKFRLDFSLLIDYYSIGCLNKIKFYTKRGLFNYKDFWYSIISYLRYSKREKVILNRYRNIVLVSKEDIYNIRKISDKPNYIYIPNGVDLNRNIKKNNITKKTITLGIIAHWTFISIDETRWFIDTIFKDICKKYDNVKLKIAGRGNCQLAMKYWSNIPNVEFLGPVDSLDDFFNSLDIYVATVPKGCGILNKILDAFSYKVFTIGNVASFSAFRELQNGYLICESSKDYLKALDFYMHNPDLVKCYTNNAYNYVKEKHNWDINYEPLLNEINNI